MSAMFVAVSADHFGVDALATTGSAGAVTPGLKIGDGCSFKTQPITMLIWQPWLWLWANVYATTLLGAPTLRVETFESVLAQGFHILRLGHSVTGDSFIGGAHIKIDAIFQKSWAVEMEGEHARRTQCQKSLSYVPWVIAARDANITFDDIIQAGKQSAAILAESLARL